MVNNSETINSIERKAQLLIAKMTQLENENVLLLQKNRELLEQNRTLQTDLLLRNSEISYLKKQLEAVERTEGVEHNQHLRTEINQYITEIDKCIEWLQNQ